MKLQGIDEYITEASMNKNVTISDEAFYRLHTFSTHGELGIGSFAHRHNNRHSDYAILRLDDYDKSITKNIKVKPGEHIYRYETPTSKIGGMQPFVKINITKGIVYFLTDTASREDIVEFQTKGSKVVYLTVREDYK